MEYDHARIIANAVNSNVYNAITDAAKIDNRLRME